MRWLSLLRSIFRNRRGVRDLPRFLTYTVTFTCNARCIMCDSWKIPSPNDLSLEEIDRVFSQLPQMDFIRLTGGEPFVRRDMVQIANLALKKLRPLVLHVTTNGFLTQRIVEFCEQRDRTAPLHMLVSIDGLKEKHNHVRGNDTAWDSVMKTLHALAPRQKELRLSLAVNQTIVDADGVEHYKKLRDVLAPLGVHNNMVMAYDTSATYSVERDINVAPTEIGQFSTFGQFTTEHLRELIAEVRKDLVHRPIDERIAKSYYLRGIENRLMKRAGVPNPPCVALNSHLRIFPNGDVPTCQFNSRVVGNLRESSFTDVWHSATAVAQRDWVKKCPGCWAECEVLPSALYTGDIALYNLFGRTPPDSPLGPVTLSERPAATLPVLAPAAAEPVALNLNMANATAAEPVAARAQ